jgi:RND family efflux transporter MFP subunit
MTTYGPPHTNNILVSIRLITVLTLVVCFMSCAKPEDTTPAQAEAPVVPVTKATRSEFTSHLVLTAEFEPFQEIEVMAKVAGYVKSIRVDIGDRVHQGQLLATLEVPEMQDEQAKAAASIQQAAAEVASASDELQRAESAHQMAHLSYTRMLDVSKREPGLVPMQEVDEIHSRDLVAEAQVSAAKSNLRAVEQKTRVAQAEENRLKTLYRYTDITAPFAGVITKRYANVGAMIQAGTASQSQAMPIVRLSQNTTLRLMLPVPESAVSRVLTGDSVDVRVPSIAKTFPGRVARFTGKVQQATRTMDTEVDVSNPSLTLLPGMYAEVDLHADQRNNVLAVPLDAIERKGDVTRVYQVGESGSIRIVPVVLGTETAQKVEIRSGLEEGAVVIVGRFSALKEGQKVQTKTLDLSGDQSKGNR